MKRFLFLYLFSFSILLCAKAELPHLDFHLFGREAVLSSSNTTCITQDALGYIWIGTADGLNRFDGYTMKIYRHLSEDSLSLPNNHIRSIFSDSKGNLWVGTNNGICIYLPDYDCFKKYDINEIFPEYEAHQVSCISESHNGDIFLSTANHLIRYSFKTDSLDLFITLKEGEVSSIEFDSLNHIWISTINGGGLYYVDDNGKISKRYLADPNDPKGINSNTIFDLVIRRNKLWIATEGGGVNCLNLENQEFKQYPTAGAHEKYTRYAYQDNNGRLWIGDYTGIKIYDDSQDVFYGYYHDSKDPESIPPNAASIYQDIQGNYWILHNFGGVSFCPVKRGMKIYTSNPQDKWHSSFDNIASVEEDDKGNLWISNPYNGIDVFSWAEEKTYRFNYIQGDRNSLGDGATFDMFWDGELMWVGTHRGGLQYMDKGLNKFITYTNNPSDTTSLACNDIRSVTSDSDGNIWLAVHGKGVDKFDRESGIFTHYNHEKNNLSNNWTYELLVDSYDELWVASAWGLSRLKKGEQKFNTYFFSQSNPNSLNGSEVTTIFEDRFSRIWIGTNNGLNLYNRNNDNFSRIGGPLESKIICAILNDADDNLWISTQHGLYRYNPKKLTFKRFDEADGLLSTEFYPRSRLKNVNSELLFGSIKGLVVINPDHLNYNEKPPKVILSDLKLFNESVKNYGPESVLNKNISYADQVHLAYDQNMVTFEFTAINLVQPGKNEYAYKMEGFDDDWRYIGTRREATYTNLSPGNYTFRVIASNNDGVWNEEGASIRVIIKRPWWMTWWFRTLVFICILCLVAAIIIVRNKQLVSQKAILAEKVQLKTQELRKKNELLREQTEFLNESNALLVERQQQIIEQSEKLQELNSTKDRFFSIIAHDLTSPFNTILGFTELLSTDFEKMNEKQKIKIATAINDSAKRVHGLLDNLLKWARSQTNGMKYNPKEIHIESVFSEVIELFEIRLNDKGIKLNITNEDDFIVYADEDMLKTVLRNLVSNAIKYTGRGGTLSISAAANHTKAIISVSDTGIGMKPELIDKLFDMKTSFTTNGTDGETGSGIGLILTHEFVQKNKGRLSVDSSHGKGTTFKFTLPLA